MPIEGLRKADRYLGLAEAVVICVFLAALIFVGAFQAISRNFFKYNPHWVDPIIRSSVFVIGLLGAAMAAQSDRLINIDLLSRVFPARGKLFLKIVTGLVSILVCWWFIKSGMIVYDTEKIPTDEALIKGEWVAMALPVTFVLIGVHLAVQTVLNLYYFATKKEPPPSENAGLML